MKSEGATVKMKTGCGPMYVTLNGGEPLLFSARIGKAGTCVRSQVSAQMSLIDLAMKKGATAQEVIDAIGGHLCHQSNANMGIMSCADALAQSLRDLTQ